MKILINTFAVFAGLLICCSCSSTPEPVPYTEYVEGYGIKYVNKIYVTASRYVPPEIPEEVITETAEQNVEKETMQAETTDAVIVKEAETADKVEKIESEKMALKESEEKKNEKKYVKLDMLFMEPRLAVTEDGRQYLRLEASNDPSLVLELGARAVIRNSKDRWKRGINKFVYRTPIGDEWETVEYFSILELHITAEELDEDAVWLHGIIIHNDKTPLKFSIITEYDERKLVFEEFIRHKELFSTQQ